MCFFCVCYVKVWLSCAASCQHTVTGYDTKSLLFEDLLIEKNATVFELDLPLTQQRKLLMQLTQETLHCPLSVRYIPVNFSKLRYYHELPPILTTSGYDPTQPSLWLMEGLSMYLPQSEFVALLHFISKSTTSKSLLFFDFFTPCMTSRNCSSSGSARVCFFQHYVYCRLTSNDSYFYRSITITSSTLSLYCLPPLNKR